MKYPIEWVGFFLLVLFVLIVWTQVILPLKNDEPLFPAFRKAKKETKTDV